MGDERVEEAVVEGVEVGGFDCPTVLCDRAAGWRERCPMGQSDVGTFDLMGAWGPGLYENDAARDWSERLKDDANGVEFIEEALRDVNMSAYVDATVGERGLVAADVVARIRRSGDGGDFSTYAEHVLEWLKQNPDADADLLVLSAQDAIQRIRSEDSELVAIWTNRGDSDLWMWFDAIDELELRLS